MPSEDRSARYLLFWGLYPLIGGVVSLLGWVIDVQRLTAWDNRMSIQPNPSLAAAAAGTALVLVALGRTRAVGWLGFGVFLIGAGTLFEHASGANLGIDTLLIFGRAWGSSGTLATGRMGPPAATSWTLVGAALLLLGAGRSRQAVATIGLLVMGITAFSLVGYLFGAASLYAVPYITTIALQTSTMLFAAGCGLVAAVPDCQPISGLRERSAAGSLIRRTLPFLIILPLVVGFFRVQGQNVGLYDTATGTAMLVLVLIALLCAVLWSGAAAVRAHERELVASSQTRDRAEMVLSNARDQFSVLDRNWHYTFVNDSLMATTGLTREQMLGRTLWEVFPAIRDTGLEAAARRVMEGRELEAVEYFHASRSRWFENRIYPTPEGGIAILGSEVTDRKAAEAAMRETQDVLRDANQRKDEFLAMLAHELRNPLAPIRNATQLLSLLGPTEPRLLQARDIIDRQTTHLARLVDDLLDVSRITRGQISLQREPVELQTVVASAVEIARPLVDRLGHTLTVSHTHGSVRLDGDFGRLVQVVSNLLTNAAKFTPPPGTITLTTQQTGGTTTLRVRDTGVGIPREFQDKLFDLFMQGDDGLARTHGGLGIGLTLVKHIVELHGGTVQVHSDGLNHGSEFVVTLPALSKNQAVTTPRAAAPSPRAGRPLQVLVVEDNIDAAESFQLLLELRGHEVRVAHNARQALELIEAFVPDVGFLDVGLPDIDGYELATRLRAHPSCRSSVLIALTGYGQLKDKERAARVGFDHHLTKPVDLDAIDRILASVSARGGRAQGQRGAAQSQ